MDAGENELYIYTEKKRLVCQISSSKLLSLSLTSVCVPAVPFILTLEGRLLHAQQHGIITIKIWWNCLIFKKKMYLQNIHLSICVRFISSHTINISSYFFNWGSITSTLTMWGTNASKTVWMLYFLRRLNFQVEVQTRARLTREVQSRAKLSNCSTRWKARHNHE